MNLKFENTGPHFKFIQDHLDKGCDHLMYVYQQYVFQIFVYSTKFLQSTYRPVLRLDKQIKYVMNHNDDESLGLFQGRCWPLCSTYVIMNHYK